MVKSRLLQRDLTMFNWLTYITYTYYVYALGIKQAKNQYDIELNSNYIKHSLN